MAWAPRLARGPPDATALVHQSGGGIWTLPLAGCIHGPAAAGSSQGDSSEMHAARVRVHSALHGEGTDGKTRAYVIREVCRSVRIHRNNHKTDVTSVVGTYVRTEY